MTSLPYETVRGAAIGGQGPRAKVAGGHRGLFGALLEVVLTWQQRTADRRRLRDMSDHILHDIGVARAEVEHEAAKPFWRV